MREIEIKAKLLNKDLVMKKLSALGCVFEPEIKQSDTVYCLKAGSVKTYRSNKNFLRLRVRNDGKVLFTVKQPQKNHLDKIEYETEIGSRDKMEQALLLLGYQEAVCVDKKRIITHYNGCEICIDDIKDLGLFIEMEKLVPEGNGGKIQEELFKFFETLGISRDDRVLFGYDILMLQKNK